MRPERIADLVGRWVRFYTRNLPAPVAERRVDEIDADLHDQIAHERADGTGDRRIALGIAGRMLRGLAADVAWRRHAIARPTSPKEEEKMSKPTSRPAIRVALATASILLVLLLASQISEGMDWGVFDYALAGVMLGGSGLLLHQVATRRAGHFVLRIAAGAIGIAAIGLGEADDAPGLVLFGCLLILSTVALTVRRAQRSG